MLQQRLSGTVTRHHITPGAAPPAPTGGTLQKFGLSAGFRIYQVTPSGAPPAPTGGAVQLLYPYQGRLVYQVTPGTSAPPAPQPNPYFPPWGLIDDYSRGPDQNLKRRREDDSLLIILLNR